MAGSTGEFSPRSAPRTAYGRRWTDAKPAPLRTGPDCAFVSQLLADCDQAHAQPEHSASEGAIGAYANGGAMAVRRLPAGYRTTILA
jgi:hypothetical protein